MDIKWLRDIFIDWVKLLLLTEKVQTQLKKWNLGPPVCFLLNGVIMEQHKSLEIIFLVRMLLVWS